MDTQNFILLGNTADHGFYSTYSLVASLLLVLLFLILGKDLAVVFRNYFLSGLTLLFLFLCVMASFLLLFSDLTLFIYRLFQNF